MTATTTRRPTSVPTGTGGFGRLLRAEWTKLTSVPRWIAGVLAAGVLTVLMSILAASGSGADANQWIWQQYVPGPDGAPVEDNFFFVHQPLSGDGTVTAQVISQEGREIDGPPGEVYQESGMAGLVIKESTEAGAPYAAIMVTPDDGVRLQSNFETDLAGSGHAAPRWLRLTRTGTSITGYESADGTTWDEVGTVELDGLAETAEVGLFAGSPNSVRVERQFGSTSVGGHPTMSIATFGDATLEPALPQATGTWSGAEVGKHGAGEYTESGGTFTVTGSGDIAPYDQPDDDVVQVSLVGVLIGLMVIATIGVLFMTSEYKRGMIRTSFVVSPRRGRVLAAKAIVIGTAAFVVGLVASLVAFLIARPILRSGGFAPPAFPEVSLSDPLVWRAITGSALLLALAAVFSLGLATVLRRSAGAITLAIGLFIVPLLVGTALPAGPAKWLMWLTPAGGFAMQRSREPTDTLVEPWSMISPLAGFVVLSAYTAAALALAFWLLRRRDA